MQSHFIVRRIFWKPLVAAATAAVLISLLVGCAGHGNDDVAPLTVDEQTSLSGSQAVQAIQSGRMTAESYVTNLLAREERLRDLNAIITLNRDGAIAAAKKIDADRSAGKVLPPLAGMPIVVKDNINTGDLPTSGGTLALRTFRPTRNAPSLQRLLDAGAIIIGKANMHELAFGITSTNTQPFAGPVKNPYDKTRIPGGSSGGTAVAIAARIVPAGLGTDTGGSSRIPPALTGIVGFRPSVGNGGTERRYLDTVADVIPISYTRDTVGPMGRTVVDVALLDSVITGKTMPTAVSLTGLRLGTPKIFWDGLDNDLATVMNAAKKKLSDAGVVFVDVDLTGLADLNNKVSFQVALHEPLAAIPAYLVTNGAPVTLTDIVNQISSPDVKIAFGAVMADVYGGAYPDAMNIYRPALQKLYADYFTANNVDAIFFPTTPLPAVSIDAVNGSSTVSINGGPPVDEFGTFIRNTDASSNAGIPGLALPAGMTQGGLPVGLEIDGPLGSDQRLLGIGLSIEALLGSLPAPNP